MKINLSTFRAKIIITLVLVISTFSFLSFYLYSSYLSERVYKNAEENILNMMSFLRDEINSIHDGRLIKPLLKNIGKDNQLFRTYLFDAKGKIKLPENQDSSFNENSLKDSLNFDKLISSEEDIFVSTIKTNGHPFSRAFLRVRSSQVCLECHGEEEETLGYIVLDFSMQETRENIAFTRNYTIFFTIFLLVIILSFVFVLHYKFVKKSLSHFKNSINIINQGDLTERVKIPESKELGQLGKSFNQMIENFQHTQKELFRYHQKEMMDANKLATVGEMAARLAHEVRNPLMGIANSIEIIIGEMQDNPNKPILEEIKRQANRVNIAISNLLKFSRSTDISMSEGNINEIVTNLVFFLRNQKQNKDITFMTTLDTEIPVFGFDTEQIENVLLNLGINAVQAIQDQGTITFVTTFSPDAKMVTIAVEDTGSGVPAEKAPDIFKPFFTTRTEGTGLGLAISKDIIEKHNGKISFENKETGGSIFTITLPTNTA
jgi:signal transduction histidine kinase